MYLQVLITGESFRPLGRQPTLWGHEVVNPRLGGSGVDCPRHGVSGSARLSFVTMFLVIGDSGVCT